LASAPERAKGAPGAPFRFERVADAQRDLQSGQTVGKLVLTPRRRYFGRGETNRSSMVAVEAGSSLEQGCLSFQCGYDSNP